MGLDEDRQPLTKEEALALIEGIEEDILEGDIDEGEEVSDEEETGVATGFDFGGNLDDIETLHPFEAMKTIMGTLRAIKRTADIYSDQKNADWGRISLSAVKEIRLAMRDILPVWEEMENRFNQKKEGWIDKLIDFNCEYLVSNYGQHAMVDYMNELNEFREAIDGEN